MKMEKIKKKLNRTKSMLKIDIQTIGNSEKWNSEAKNNL